MKNQKPMINKIVKYGDINGKIIFIDENKKTFFAEFNHDGKISVAEFYFNGKLALGYSDENCVIIKSY